jgi:iron complex transport system permease protein
MKKSLRSIWILVLLLLASLILSVGVGSVTIPLKDLFSLIFGGQSSSMGQGEPFATILFQLRIPHAVLMMLVGASLAGSGAAYQGLFRNPLADPYLIGVASGAGLGAIAAMAVRWPYNATGMFAIPLAAFAGALLAVFIVYQLARVSRTVPTTNLLLAGVAVSSFATALTSYLLLQATGDLRRALVWQLGGSTMTGWEPVLGMLPYALLGLGIILINAYPLNVLQFGDEQAQQMGVHVENVRRWVVIAASMATAAAVAFAGVIGFVGLVVPHVIRLIWGGDYRRLLPFSILGGAVMLLLTDLAARTVIAPQELPVGVLTSLLGAPFFLWVLRRSKSQNYW